MYSYDIIMSVRTTTMILIFHERRKIITQIKVLLDSHQKPRGKAFCIRVRQCNAALNADKIKRTRELELNKNNSDCCPIHLMRLDLKNSLFGKEFCIKQYNASK